MATPIQMGAHHMITNRQFEPQRPNNFELQIVGLSNAQTLTLSVQSSSAPNETISPIEIPYGNGKVKFAGLPEFADGNVVVNDYIDADTEKIISDWQKTVYDPTTQKIGYAADYKKTGYLIEYSPDGAKSRMWQLYGCWPSAVDYGEFNQDGGDRRQITITLTYDYAVRV